MWASVGDDVQTWPLNNWAVSMVEGRLGRAVKCADLRVHYTTSSVTGLSNFHTLLHIFLLPLFGMRNMRNTSPPTPLPTQIYFPFSVPRTSLFNLHGHTAVPRCYWMVLTHLLGRTRASAVVQVSRGKDNQKMSGLLGIKAHSQITPMSTLEVGFLHAVKLKKLKR